MKARQQALVDALLGRSEPPAGIDPRGLAVYRGNAQALSARALGEVFGRLREALGADEFAALAWTFWRAHPPERGDLGQWGGALAGFLAERAGEASGLPDLARLDWALHEAERAADAALDAASLDLLASMPAEALRLRLRPGVALLAQAAGPVLVWRDGWRGQWQALPAADAVFVRGLLAGASLGEAVAAAGAGFDFGAWLQAALRQAWLQGASLIPVGGT